MPSLRAGWSVVCLAVAISLSIPILLSAQGTTGRVLGKVADPSGAILAGVKVTLVNEATNVSRDTTTNQNGDYDFVEVPVGTYRVEFDFTGFKKNIRRGVALDINQVITLNMTMQLGATQEVVDVTSEAPLVETTSTQLGAVVGDRAVSQLPLNSRDTYQFLQLQPGVMSTVGSSNSIVYGSNNAGAVSVNGGRGRSNNFSVNGGDANDQFVNLPTVQPSPDSIQEFRVLTNTFDAEYGRNSGSVVNVVTKSGTNQLHGNVYEFFRNKVLNANAYCFSADGCPKPQFNQNQFGGTFGGPIVKDRTFFFTSYEGRRIRQGVQSPAVTVPTAAERPSESQPFGDFSSESIFPGTLSSAFALNQRPGCANAVPTTNANGEFLVVGGQIQDGVAYSDLFPGNIIPLACMDATAVDLLQFVPTPANGNTLVTVPVQPERGDQFTVKVDHRINDRQNLSIYYYFDDHRLVSPFAQFQAAGANVPGFASITAERFQQWNISHTWTINNSTVNEFRFNYNREAQRTFQHPQRTSLVQDSCPPAPSWLTDALGSVPCFNDGQPGNPTGIHPGLGPDREGLPFIQLSGGFTIGNNGEGELPQVGNSFQWSDSISKVVGTHSFKFGGDVRRQRFDQTLYFDVSGEYFVDGSSSNTTGGDTVFSDYLLGFPGSYGQGSAQVENVRSTALYLFAQDSWKLKPNLTLNYGLRWEFTTPITDISKHVQTFRPGAVSTVYPCQLSADSIATFQSYGVANPDCNNTGTVPTGLVVPGDQGIPPGLTQSYYKAFAPRIGIAWSPGNSGKTSIRAGWGLFYNPIEQLVLEQFSAEPPFGGSTFPVDTLFNQPFLSQDGGTTYPNPFNGILNPPRGQPVDWSTFRPILLFGQFQPKMRSQYSAQYNLTIQRELTKDLKFQVGYVGSQGHRLLATHDLNYGNPQTCLDLQAISDHYLTLTGNPNDPNVNAYACGPYYADSAFGLPANTVPSGMSIHLPNGDVVTGPNAQAIGLVGLRKYSSPLCNPVGGYDEVNGVWTNGCPPDGIPVFSSIFAQDTIANSAYNSLQASLDKRFAHGLQFTAAYTFSKSFDEASSFEGILNPIDPRRSRSLSSFDARHRIVFSYYWEPPVHKYSGAKGQIVNGWALSGITTFQTGFPIRISTLDDQELMYSFDFELPGEPDLVAPFRTFKPQSNGNYFFDPSSFSEDNTFGRIGNSPRTICCGPHISSTDFAVLKTFAISETKHVDFRGEFFNLFNHSQFFNPDGNFSDGSQFGQITQARDPRLMQFALKFFF
ncbi:MAG TPA: carboxypeptidase regulatory-like domain-containing protein [Candidatus Sulfotelmatobacter sp.]|nr:carboxypeptidase regulatory-like domain-containing protein [Candidatus Sulfotelmatobacter sp.]